MEIKIEICDCEPQALTVLRYNFWPMSPSNPKTMVHMDLMETFRVMSLECHVSALGFANALKYKYSKYFGYTPLVNFMAYYIFGTSLVKCFVVFKYHHGICFHLQIKDFSQLLGKEPMEAYRYFVSSMQNPLLHDGYSICPACFQVSIN